MNYQLDNLTSKQNINLFSTPKFRDILFDNDGTNKNNIFKFDSIPKNSPKFGGKNQSLKIMEKPNEETDNIINNDKNLNSKIDYRKEIYLKENFSLSSLKNNSGNNDKKINSKNIIDIKINSAKKKEKDDKCNVALISFCEKSDNYSFNNCSCSTNKDKQEINNTTYSNANNNNLKTQKEKKFKESEIKNVDSNSNHNSNNSNNSNSNGNNSNSFKYTLPLENDKIPLINDFMDFQNNNDINNNINNDINNNINNYINNDILDIKNDKNKEKKSIELDKDISEQINNSFKKNNSIKENLLYQYKTNNVNNDKKILEKKVKKSKTEILCKIDTSFPLDNNSNNANNKIDNKNKSVIEKKSINNNSKNLVIKKAILHSYDNYKKIKKKIKSSAIKEIHNKFKEKEKDNQEEISKSEKVNKIMSPRKQFELIIKQIDINMDNNPEEKEENNNQLYSFTSREPKIKFNMANELKLNSHRKLESDNYNINDNFNMNNNYNSNYISNTTNKLKNKNRKFIKSSPIDYNKTFFNFNKIKKLEDNNSKTISRANKELTYINKKINNLYKTNLPKNFIKKDIKDLKIINNKKNSFHTRNISNLYSNQIFNGIKNLFNNNNFIYNTINYETNEIGQKEENKNILETQIKFKPHIKNIIKNATHIQTNKNTKIKNINKINQKEIPHLYLKNNNKNKIIHTNNNNYNINNRYYTIVQDKNNKSKNLKLQKKGKENNLIKSTSKYTTFNKFKKYLLNNKNNKNILNIENKNQSTYKLPISNIISGANTDRIIHKNKYSSVNFDNKSLINDSVFININDSSNSLQNESRNNNNKIKVNTISMNKKHPYISELSSNIKNKTNSYWKIHKKAKNSCLINNNNEKNPSEDNNSNSNLNNNSHNITLGENNEKNIKGNTQILFFNKNKNKPNKFTDLNTLKERIYHYNSKNDNSKSIVSEPSYTDKNNYSNSINENLNIEKTKLEMKNLRNKYITAKNSIHHNKTLNINKPCNKKTGDVFKIKQNELTSNTISNSNYKSKIQNFKEEILKYSILRNNQNNQIINEFSVVLGEEKDKNLNQKNETIDVNNKISKISNKSLENKRTIINVNQFYPSYYIDTHELPKNKNNKI